MVWKYAETGRTASGRKCAALPRCISWHNGWQQQKITLEDVAAHSGFNPTYFSEKFKEKTGKNFTDFLTEVRMEAAKELLRDSRKTIGQIGDAVGYKDAKYFSQQFTKCVGMKPTEYRKLYY